MLTSREKQIFLEQIRKNEAKIDELASELAAAEHELKGNASEGTKKMRTALEKIAKGKGKYAKVAKDALD